MHTTESMTAEVGAVQPLPLGYRLINLLAITLPIAGLIFAAALIWGNGFSWLEASLLVSMYLITGFGVTIGFHRFFAHKSFDTSRVMQAILGVLGSMAVEGPILRWVAIHRCHHQHSDKDDDPHSPHIHGTGFWNMIRGMWWAHVGWIYKPGAPDTTRYVKDLQSDGLIRWISRLFPLWVVIGFLIPTLIGWLVTMSWMGALLGFLWGGLVRTFFVHHITWSINSACHIWGTQPFRSHDHSRNNVLFGIVAFGEGWHNNHHAFPTSARHGLRWWQFDISYTVIWMLARVGLVWNVRTPSVERVAARLS